MWKHGVILVERVLPSSLPVQCEGVDTQESFMEVFGVVHNFQEVSDKEWSGSVGRLCEGP